MGVIGTSLSRTVSNTKLDGDRPNERVLALFFIDPGKLTLATTHRFVQCEYEPASDLKCQYDVENLQQGLDQIYPFDQFDLKFTRDATAELPNSVVMIAKSTNMQSGYTLLNFDSEATNLLFDLVPGEIGRAGLSDKRHFFPHLFYNSGATGSPVFGVVDEKIHPAIYRRNAGDGTKYVRADLNSDWVMTDDLIVADQTFDFVVNDIDGMKHFGYVGILRTGSSDGGENASGRLVFVPEEGGVAARRVLSDIKDVSLVKTFGVPGGPSLILFRYGDDGGHLGIGQWTHLDDPALFKFKYLAFEVGVMSDLSGFSMNAGLHAIPNTANSIGFFARKNDKPGLGRLMPDDPNDLATWCAF
jgi:hypothetical protein